MSLLDILDQYRDATAAAPSPAQVEQHFDQVAAGIPAPQLGPAVASAFRADATPPFPDMVGQLFGRSSPDQRAGLLNEILGGLGPAALSALRSAGGGLGGLLGGLLGGASSSGPPPQVTPAQANQVSPDDVRAMAAHAQAHDPSIVDRLGSFYARHPMLVKTLGAVALSAVMGNLRSRSA